MIEHESTCCFNPAAKGCYTCKHYEDIGMPISGSMPHCNRGENASEVLWESIICKLHEVED